MPHPNVWFTADTHFSHKNILKHCPARLRECGSDNVDIHDKWLIDKWNSVIKKKDIVYILGDLMFARKTEAIKILQQLHGNKFLILGNHDGSCDNLTNYFKQVTQMKLCVFKKDMYPFLKEDFMTFLCHYPMITWPQKHCGVVELHGHCHGRLDEYNTESPDLRVDVGIDGQLAQYGFVSLEQVYQYMMNKAGIHNFHEYAESSREQKSMII